MALKPTIYKLRLDLSDLNRNYYDSNSLTLALHPSETDERLMVRLLAYCLNANPQLQFCKGLSDTEEPDLWSHSLDGNLLLWIEVGEPSVERIKKASRAAQEVSVFCFNSKASTWWELNKEKLEKTSAKVFQFDWEQIQALAKLLERTMELSVTITGDSAFIASGAGECEVKLTSLTSHED